MLKKILFYIGLGFLAVSVVLGFFVLGNGIKYCSNEKIMNNGVAVERVKAAEEKEEAQKALVDLAVVSGLSVIVAGGFVFTSVCLPKNKKRR